jgi:hypothetical protein
MSLWTATQVRRAQRILRKYHVTKFREALDEIGRALDMEVTPNALYSAFRRRKLGSPSAFCKQKAEPAGPPVTVPDAATQKLIALTRREPVPFSTLCDKLDMAPSKVRSLIEKATASGIQIHVEHDHVGVRSTYQEDRIQTTGIAPVVGKRQKVAVISDTHLGSKYVLRDALRDFIQYAYDQGVREILHPGDVLDGMYRHGIWEVSHPGLQLQAEDLFETLPHLPGLTYHCITGNHDFTFTEANGVNVGQYITTYFRARGRNDIRFYGDRGAFLQIRGALVHLWHPRSGGSYAKSYGIQKHIEKYSSGEKPHILLCGHWHVFCHVYERGVHGIACPTFQGGGSAFSKSLGGAPAIGGLILSWMTTKHGTLRNFSLENRSYFEAEKPHRVEDREEIHVPSRR